MPDVTARGGSDTGVVGRSLTGKRVAIVGGGLSGLAYAGVLRDLGFEPVLFEKCAAVGGHW